VHIASVMQTAVGHLEIHTEITHILLPNPDKSKTREVGLPKRIGSCHRRTFASISWHSSRGKALGPAGELVGVHRIAFAVLDDPPVVVPCARCVDRVGQSR
jgi:hypothetical protein